MVDIKQLDSSEVQSSGNGMKWSTKGKFYY